MTELNSKVALITGGSKGIGYGIAQALVNQGMHVAVTSRSETAALKAAEALNSGVETGHAIGLEADVRSFEGQQRAVAKVIDRFGRIDVVIANVGLGHFASVEDLTIE